MRKKVSIIGSGDVGTNAALEKWLDTMNARGQRPDLAIDFHNDASGKLHFPRPERNDENNKKFEAFKERITKANDALAKF